MRTPATILAFVTSTAAFACESLDKLLATNP